MAVDIIARGMASSNKVTDEQIKKEVDEYLAENPPEQGATPEQVNQINENTKRLDDLVTVLADGNVRLTY